MQRNIKYIDIDSIMLNPHQPRTRFEEEKVVELANSIAENGLIQPIVVRIGNDGYELVAGERRLRALKYLNYTQVEAVIANYNEKESAKVAIIENIQRENLSPIEEAKAYQKLIEEYGFTQAELAQSLGKAQSTVANKIRLLNLDDKVIEGLNSKALNERQGRALLKLEKDQQGNLVDKIINDDLNVSQTEKLVDKQLTKKKKPNRKALLNKTDYRLEANTIKQALESIKKMGVKVDVDEEHLDDCYKIEIILKK